jgi:hypothetical protein
MHPINPNSGLIQAANQAQEMARAARREKMALAFQIISGVNMAVLTGMAAFHLIRDIRRAEREGGRGR